VCAGVEPVEQGARREDAGERHAGGDPLGQDDDVRRCRGPFGGEEAAGASEAGLDLVDGEQDPVAVGHVAQRREEAIQGRHVAALAEHRLDHERRHVVGIDHGGEQLLDRVQGEAQGGLLASAGGVTQRVRKRREVHAPGERLVVPAIPYRRGG
jgi:hypothetical protein